MYFRTTSTTIHFSNLLKCLNLLNLIFFWLSYRSKNYIFEKPLKNGCRNMRHILIFVIKFFFPNYESYRSIFFNVLALKNWTLNMHFNPIHIISGLFLGGGRETPSPRPYIDSDPPAFIGLKLQIYLIPLVFSLNNCNILPTFCILFLNSNFFVLYRFTRLKQ